MKKYIDINTWKRKNHYYFFREFEDPSYSFTVRMNMTRFMKRVKSAGRPVYLSYLHAALFASNEIPAMSLRMDGKGVYSWDTLHAGPTVDRPDGTYGHSRILFNRDFETFRQGAEAEIERVRQSKDLDTNEMDDVIFFSTVPWFSFTALSQPHYNRKNECIPKIVFGRITEENGRLMMHVAIQVNHILIDGRDSGEFVQLFQKYLDTGS